MRATIGWSYDLLTPTEQTLFRQLAVFVGGCSLEAVEAICGGDDDAAIDVLADVESLVARSLLRTEVVAGTPRFMMLETVREYALERLDHSGEGENLRQHHATYFLDVAERAEMYAAEAEGVHQGFLAPGWLEQLAPDEENFRTAHDWAIRGEQAELALRLGAALWRFWYFRRHLSEGRGRLGAALTLIPRSPQTKPYLVARARALVAAARLAEFHHDHTSARVLLDECLAVNRATDDRASEAATLQALGLAAFFNGDTAAAAAVLDRSLALAGELGDERIFAAALTLRGLVAHYQGDLIRARALLEESVSRQRQHAQRPNDDTMACLAFVLLDLGDTAKAEAVLVDVLTFLRARGFRRGVGATTCILATVALASGDRRRASGLLDEGMSNWYAAGEWGGGAFIIACCAEWADAVGLREQARWLVSAAAELRRLGATSSAQSFQARLMHILRRLAHLIGPPPWPPETGGPAKAFAHAFAYALEAVQADPPSPGSSAASRSEKRRCLLTPREGEIAALVAEGLTNREIAVQLVLSERTAATHVEHILGKLGFHSRAQIAAWVAGNAAKPGS
jgi:DNA-binding CsgD family transcriptional regulator